MNRENSRRESLVSDLYRRYLEDENTASFIQQVSQRYTLGTIERLLRNGVRDDRRGAALMLGFVADYESNAVLGMALHDEDRAVRTISENSIRSIWCRDGNEAFRQKLTSVMRMNSAHQYAEAVSLATQLVEEAPWFAEAWNQRAIASYNQAKFSESVADCHQSLEINPYHFAAAAGMGQSYLQLGNRSYALEAFRRALKLNPNLEGVRATISYLERSLNKEQS